MAHVTNQHDAFKKYEPANGASIARVGNSKTKIEVCGTILLESHYKGKMFILRLENVLYIPTNHNSLLSLGRWDNAGGSYSCQHGHLVLTKDKRIAAIGWKITNNLYQLNVTVHKLKVNKNVPQVVCAINEKWPTWEMWHYHYGHISYNGLQKLYKNDMVDAISIWQDSPISDCVTRTEAKQYEEPHNKHVIRNTELGELTHMDLWGKYDIVSINSWQYYIVLVDDVSHMITVDFLKGKNEAAQKS